MYKVTSTLNGRPAMTNQVEFQIQGKLTIFKVRESCSISFQIRTGGGGLMRDLPPYVMAAERIYPVLFLQPPTTEAVNHERHVSDLDISRSQDLKIMLGERFLELYPRVRIHDRQSGDNKQGSVILLRV